jgi:hypothetical protein
MVVSHLPEQLARNQLLNPKEHHQPGIDAWQHVLVEACWRCRAGANPALARWLAKAWVSQAKAARVSQAKPRIFDFLTV